MLYRWENLEKRSTFVCILSMIEKSKLEKSNVCHRGNETIVRWNNSVWIEVLFRVSQNSSSQCTQRGCGATALGDEVMEVSGWLAVHQPSNADTSQPVTCPLLNIPNLSTGPIHNIS